MWSEVIFPYILMMLCCVMLSNLHSSIFLVSSIFGIVLGILYLGASGNVCPLLLFVLVGLFHSERLDLVGTEDDDKELS